MTYIGNLPSYAAAAWYFNKIPNKPKNLSTGCSRPASLPPTLRHCAPGRAQPAGRGAGFHCQTGEPLYRPQRGLRQGANLRISPTRFRKEVLRDERYTLGRYDMRFEGEDVDAAGENPSYDPSDSGIGGAFISALHDYLQRDLKYESTDAYRPSAETIGEWDWHHRASGFGRGGMQSQPDVAGDLAAAIRKNPHLKVFSANGYFDLATPFSSPNTTSRTCSFRRSCAATCSSAITHRGT